MRGFCALAVVLWWGVCVNGQQGSGMAVATELRTPMLLWPAGAPGAQGDADVDKPTLTVYLPAGVNATKTGVVVAPGGLYQHLAMAKEGDGYCALAECAWSGCVCAEVQAGADVSSSD